MIKENLVEILKWYGFECKYDYDYELMVCEHESGKVKFSMEDFTLNDSEVFLELFFNDSKNNNVGYKFDLNKLENFEIYIDNHCMVLHIIINDNWFKISLE